MNFFEHQELARRQTRKLIALFVLAVISIVLVFNLLATLAWTIAGGALPLPAYFYPTNSALVVGLVVGGSIFETLRLRAGGDEVAQMVGARLLARDAADAYEKRLLNIVEEMAIASGVTMPRVYLMDRELGINAFAAGYSPNEAVIAVSNGALRRLNRDELQGVVAHEFSHVLNGDMRLNIRLIGVVYGLLLVASLGEQLMSSLRHARGSDGSNRSGAVLLAFVAGLALWIAGYIGSSRRRSRASANSSPMRARCNSHAIPTALAAPCARSAASGANSRSDRGSSIPRPKCCRICSSARRAPRSLPACFRPIRRSTNGSGASSIANCRISKRRYPNRACGPSPRRRRSFLTNA
jgi:Zn-dependent protease with chaperone function